MKAKRYTKNEIKKYLAKGHSLQTWKLYYEADKKMDITQAIFISHSLMARVASRISKWIDSVVRAGSNSNNK